MHFSKQVGPGTEKIIDVYGFSRGAALARTFVNVVNNSLKKRVKNLQVRFVGLFDTVGSFGIPGNGVDPGMDLAIGPAQAKTIKHYVARHEIRKNFPLMSAPGFDQWYPGAHSDVGGGYINQDPKDGFKSNRLALIPFADMCAASMAAGVSMAHWKTTLKSMGLNEPWLDSLRKDAALYTQAGTYNPQSDYGRKREAFFKKYIHKSHNSNLGMTPEKDGKRRILVPVKWQTYVSNRLESMVDYVYKPVESMVDKTGRSYKNLAYNIEHGFADLEQYLKSGMGLFRY